MSTPAHHSNHHHETRQAAAAFRQRHAHLHSVPSLPSTYRTRRQVVWAGVGYLAAILVCIAFWTGLIVLVVNLIH